MFGVWPSFYFGAAKSHLDHLDALQHQAAGIFHCTIPSIESCRHAAAIGLTGRLLDEGHGDHDLKFFTPEFVTIATRISSDPSRALRLNNPVTFKCLNSFRRSYHGSISNIWNTLPAHLLLEGNAIG